MHSLMGLPSQRSPAQQAQQVQQYQCPLLLAGQRAQLHPSPLAASDGTPHSLCRPRPHLPPVFGMAGPASQSTRCRQQQPQRKPGSSAYLADFAPGMAALLVPAAMQAKPARSDAGGAAAESAAASQAAFGRRGAAPSGLCLKTRTTRGHELAAAAGNVGRRSVRATAIQKPRAMCPPSPLPAAASWPSATAAALACLAVARLSSAAGSRAGMGRT